MDEFAPCPLFQAAAAALPRASCFFEDTQNSFQPYDGACRHFAEDSPPRAFPAASSLPPDQVALNVYELTAFEQINRLMATELLPIGGALHAGVEVYGREWSYGGGEGPSAGVRCEVPRSNCAHRFRETVALGKTPLSDGEVTLLIGELVETWQPKDYHWLHRNCLAFANELCQRLQVGRIPAWIDRFARGAGVVDMSVRGLAGGLCGGVQSVALGAQELVRAVVEGGPRSCAGCVPGVPTSGGVVYTVSCEGPSASQPWERMCAAQAWGMARRLPSLHDAPGEEGPEGFGNEPQACVAPQWRSLFEVVNDPDERITYVAGGVAGIRTDDGEAELPSEVEPRAEAEPPEPPPSCGAGGAAAAQGVPGSPGSGQAARLEKWFQMDESFCSEDRTTTRQAHVTRLALAPTPARKGAPPVPGSAPPDGRQDRASYTPTPARARGRAGSLA